jgi:hypothetical protein
MTPQEQLNWCVANYAAVRFNNGHVKVTTKSHIGITGSTLEEAIAKIERLRDGQKVLDEAVREMRER